MISDSDFCGSFKLKQTVNNLIEKDRFPQSVMLCGEDGLGRNLFARLIARDYLSDKNGLSLRHVHPDCIEIKGSGQSGEISVETIRNVTYEVNKAAVMTEGKRVVIVEDAKNLNQSSSAALLKTLEQPPSGVVFILTVSSVEDVIETVKSRCITFTIISPSVSESALYIEKIGDNYDRKTIEEYSKLFRGRIGFTVRALEEEDFRERISLAEQFTDSYSSNDEIMMCSLLERAENRGELTEILNLIVFCLARKDSNRDAITKIENMKKLLSSNVAIKLFSTVLVKEITKG